MQSWQAIADVPSGFSATAVTIGKYDGVHLGHQTVIKQLTEQASQRGLKSAVVTFDQHPNTVLAPERTPLPIIGNNQKREMLATLGLDFAIELEFDLWLASLSPREFTEQVLVNALHAKLVVIGDDFRFGAGGVGTVKTLQDLGQELGFEVQAVAGLNIDGQRVSSTRIRELLDLADVVSAAKLLGRNHVTTGVIEHGLKIGRTIGFPTANMTRQCEGYLPLDGVYAGWLHCEGERYPAALSVGTNETFQAVPRLVEAHVLDRLDLDFYDKVVSLEYVGYVRPSAKFDGVEALVAEINRDLDKIRQMLAL